MMRTLPSKLLKRLYLPYMIGWTLSFFLFSLLRGVGTVPSGMVEVDLIDGLLLSLLVGPFCGILAAVNQRYFERVVNARHSSLNKLVMLKLLSSLFLIVFITVISYSFLLVIKSDIVAIGTFVVQVESLVAYFYIFITDTVFSFIRRASILIGEERVWKLISGRYYEPRSEQKIFLFIDLKDSTSIAEKVGHLKYSKMLQDAFVDVAVVEKFGGEIYQYIGDEIVFTWDGLTVRSALDAIDGFLHFQETLDEKANNYYQKYGVRPAFKAGIHGGPITTVEVGQNKKDIAYHGDTINTAARIQQSCNLFNETLIVSETIAKILTFDLNFQPIQISSIHLKGKRNRTFLYAIRRGQSKLKSYSRSNIDKDLISA